MHELLNKGTFEDLMNASETIFPVLLIIGVGIGAIWLLVTAVHYFWTHPLF